MPSKKIMKNLLTTRVLKYLVVTPLVTGDYLDVMHIYYLVGITLLPAT